MFQVINAWLDHDCSVGDFFHAAFAAVDYPCGHDHLTSAFFACCNDPHRDAHHVYVGSWQRRLSVDTLTWNQAHKFY